MAELQRNVAKAEVYERLIDRLSVALDTAKTAVQLRDECPVVVELRGLSRDEFELIKAYLNRNERKADSRSQGSTPSADAPRTAKVIWLKDRTKGVKGKRGDSGRTRQ